MAEKKALFSVGDTAVTAVDLAVGNHIIPYGTEVVITDVEENSLEYLYSFAAGPDINYYGCYDNYLIKPNVLPRFFARPSDGNLEEIISSVNKDMRALKDDQKILHSIDKLIKGLEKEGSSDAFILIGGGGTMSTHGNISIKTNEEGLDEFKEILIKVLREHAERLQKKVAESKDRFGTLMSLYNITEEEENTNDR